jgi:hypothetical protein
MKTLQDVIAELQGVLADLQAIEAAPAPSPAQATIVNESITLSDGTVITFDGTQWSTSQAGQQ